MMIPRPHRLALLALPALMVLIAGCGAGQFGDTADAAGGLTIAASSPTVNSSGLIQFAAYTASGEPASVVWSVAGGDNAPTLGEGRISTTGLYTPPSALSADRARIEIMAHLKDNPLETTSRVVSITPGFVQSLLPENAALTAGATVQVTAEIAEVNSGEVHWTLTGNTAGGAGLGTLSNFTCRRSLDQYTTCTADYTAPSPVAQGTVFLHATIDNSLATTAMKILLNGRVNSTPLTNQAFQNGPIALGSSGGNDNDFDTYVGADGESYIADCCGGTLGALVTDGKGDDYILSNNHVLDESDAGKPGDTIDEPGMIDDGCIPLSHAGSTLRAVGTLKYAVPLASPATDVDAALASVAPGAVNPSGAILQFAAPTGPVQSSEMLGAAPPMAGTGEVLNAGNLAGLRLAKSGRTTGLTCSTVAAVDMSVKVDYFKDCAETEPYLTKIFTGQIGIAGARFSDSGDSGALVVNAANAEPVGLFFAGGTDGAGHGLSIANPIGDVLSELDAESGEHLSIVGTSQPHPVACIRYEAHPPAIQIPLTPAVEANARFVAETAGTKLVNPAQGILAVTTGHSLDAPGEAAVVFYVDRNHRDAQIPPTLNGVRTQVIFTDATALAQDAAPNAPATVDGINLSAAALAQAEAVVAQNAPRLLKNPDIFAVGATESRDDPREAALLVVVNPDTAIQSLPATLGGLRVRYMRMHRFHVTRSKYAPANAPRGCTIKKIQAASNRGDGAVAR